MNEPIVPVERWSNERGEYEINGEWLSHNNCGFTWHKDHRTPKREDEWCPLCHHDGQAKAEAQVRALREALASTAHASKRALAWFEKEGIVFHRWPSPELAASKDWEWVAATLYTSLVTVSVEARNVLEELDADPALEATKGDANAR